MTPAELKHRILRQLHYEAPANAPSSVQKDVVIAVNTAFQVLWLDVPEKERLHYTRQERSISVISGTRDYELPDDLQGVIPPLYDNATESPLQALASKSELFQFANVILGTGDTGNATPTHYYIETTGQNDNEATTSRLYLAPTPDASFTLKYGMEIEAPSLELADFCADPAPALPIPHGYVESLLLPLALGYITRSKSFTMESLRPGIEADAAAALQRVGVTDPQVWRAEREATRHRDDQ